VLYEIDIPLLTHCDSYIAKDPQLKGRVDKRRAILEKANSKELNALTFRMRKKLEHAAVVNSGSWFLYIVPIAIVGSLFKWVCAPAMNIIFVSRSELQKIAPARELEVSPA
jgi:hypothetical protein